MTTVPSDSPSVRHLLLMRHAKSDWSVAGQSDHDRALNARGRRDAPNMAQWLVDQNLRPDLVLSSTSTRTRETLAIMNQHWGRETPVEFAEALYLAGPNAILDTIHRCAGDSQRLLVLCHNPGISHLASLLADQFTELPTAAIAHFECHLEDWANLSESKLVRHIQTIRPKTL